MSALMRLYLEIFIHQQNGSKIGYKSKQGNRNTLSKDRRTHKIKRE